MSQSRKDILLTLIQEAQELLEAWQKKLLYSDNPTETKRSEHEIERVRKIIDGHYTELGQLDPIIPSASSSFHDPESFEQLIQNNQLQEALRWLLEAFEKSGQTDFLDDIRAQMGRLSYLQEQKRMDTISGDDYQRGLNKMRIAILDHKKDLKTG